MKKSLFLFVIPALLVFSEEIKPAGLGTEESPFLITTLSNFVWIQENISDTNVIPDGSYFKQTQDIDASDTTNWNSGKGFDPIRKIDNSTCTYFMINYDGGDHYISNLYINRPDEDYVGLFGILLSSIIENLKITGTITGSNYVGSIAGMADYTRIVSNEFHGLIAGFNTIGGFIGYNKYGEINHNYVNAAISGDGEMGGLVGWDYAGQINNSSAGGIISGNSCIGGLVGFNNQTIISHSSFNGTVLCDYKGGGLIGWNLSGKIYNSFIIGAISGIDELGGLVGNSGGGDFHNNYVICDISGSNEVGGIIGSNINNTINYSYYSSNKYDVATEYARSETELKQRSTFANWDFYNIWNIDENVSFPYFRNEADFEKPEGLGTLENPFIIKSLENLLWLQKNISKTNSIPFGSYFIQTQNIDAGDTTNWNSGKGFEPIRYIFEGTNTFFSINYDGKNNYISNLYINRPNESEVGLFSLLENSTIENLKITGIIIGEAYIGALAGIISNNSQIISNAFYGEVYGWGYNGGLVGKSHGEIKHSYVDGIISGYYGSSGLVSVNYGKIEHSYAIGVSYSDSSAGGLVSENHGEIEHSYFIGDVLGFYYLGGLVGYNFGEINYSYANGTVSGFDYLGGLAGYSFGEINNSYAIGDVSGSNRVGGLVGYSYLGIISNSYVSEAVFGTNNVGGLVGRLDTNTIVCNSYYNSNKYNVATEYARSEAELKQQNTFIDWDFENIWEIEEDVSFPYFRTEPIPEPIGLTMLIIAIGMFSGRKKLK